MKKLMALLLVVGLAPLGALVLPKHTLELEKTAIAQTVPGLPGPSTTGTGVGDSFSGKNEMMQTWTGTLSTSALGVICTTTSTAANPTRCSLKTLDITCATAQYVDIYDGSVIQGASVLAHVYCISNTPRTLTREQLGTGITGSLGNSLTILGSSTGACYVVYAVQRPNQ